MNWVLSLVFLAFAGLATYSYRFFSYSSDGFHYYSALRNICDRSGSLGLWEGPVFEHLLGNHFFFTLYVFQPFVCLFRSPLVLLYGGVFLHFLSIWLFNQILIVRQTAEKERVLWVVFFGLFGAGWQFALGTRSLFIPEVFLPPCILGMVLGLLQKKQWKFWLSWIFLLLSKEEFILTGVSVWIWAAVMDQVYFHSGFFRDKRFLLKNLFVYLCVAAFVFLTFRYYQGLNLRNHADRPFQYLLLLKGDTWQESVKLLRALVLPALGLIVLVWIRGKLIDRLAVVLTFFGFVFMRMVGNITVYSFVEKINHWSYLISAVPILITSFFSIQRIRESNQRRWVSLALVFAIGVCSYETRGSFTLGRMRDFFQGDTYIEATDRLRLMYRSEIPELVKLIEPRQSPRPNSRPKVDELIALPERTMWPFMERTHVALEWLLTSQGLRDEQIWAKVKYLLLPKTEALRDYEKSYIDGHFVLVGETTHFKLLKTTTVSKD